MEPPREFSVALLHPFHLRVGGQVQHLPVRARHHDASNRLSVLFLRSELGGSRLCLRRRRRPLRGAHAVFFARGGEAAEEVTGFPRARGFLERRLFALEFLCRNRLARGGLFSRRRLCGFGDASFMRAASSSAAAIFASSAALASARSAAALTAAGSGLGGSGLNFLAEGFRVPSARRFTPTGKNVGADRDASPAGGLNAAAAALSPAEGVEPAEGFAAAALGVAVAGFAAGPHRRLRGARRRGGPTRFSPHGLGRLDRPDRTWLHQPLDASDARVALTRAGVRRE